MVDLTGEIAQYIIPADGFPSPNAFWLDWARSRTFLYNAGGNLTIRAYGLSLATQTVTATRNLAFSWFAGDVDPVSGSPIIWATASDYSPLIKLSPTTLATTETYGTSGSSGSYPTSVFAPEQIVCVGVGTLASGGASQVGYAFSKETEFSGKVDVWRTDTLGGAGFSANVVSGSTNNRGFMTRGASGASGGSVFLTWNEVETATIPLYSVTISPGAETYNIASWPTPNPYITSATLGTISATAVDPTWTIMQAQTLGYDASTSHVTMIVRTGAAVTTKAYFLTLSPTDASIIRKVALTGVGSVPADLTQTRILSGALLLIGRTPGTVFGIQTLAGTDTLNTLLGAVVGSTGPLSSDDVSQLIVLNTDYLNGVNTPTPVVGTASSFSGFAILSIWPPLFDAGVADLWFAPTPDFVDLSVRSNRRLFISSEAAPISLGATGATPTGNQPPVFFSRAQGNTADSFATNLGSGGTFTLSGGDLTDALTSPPCSLEVSTTTTPPSKGVGVVGDYRNGKLHAFNMDTLLDNTSQRRWVRSWRGATEATREPVRYNSVRVDMETGAGVPVAANPQLVLRYSDDGGHNWSNPRIMSVGARGQAGWNVKATRLGATGRHSQADRIFEISSTDEFKVAIVGAVIEAG